MLTSEELTREYIARILGLDQSGPGVNAVIELNPDALVMARNADALRRQGIVKGPLHGIPVLLRTTSTPATRCKPAQGRSRSWACPRCGIPPWQQTCAPGAVILGKTNLSEWRTSGLSNRSAAGPGVVGRRTIRTASIATPAGPALARRCGVSEFRRGLVWQRDGRQHRVSRKR